MKKSSIHNRYGYKYITTKVLKYIKQYVYIDINNKQNTITNFSEPFFSSFVIM